MIYHVISQSAWEVAQDQGYYEAFSLKSEGFIHCSTLPQVAGVLHRYYKNLPDLLLLHIDEVHLSSAVKYEFAPSVNELFPHIYGPINLEAITAVEKI